MRRVFWTLTLLLLLGLTTLAVIGGWAVYTTQGAQWLLARLPNVEVEVTAGSLLNGLVVRALAWESPEERVELTDAAMHWDPACFLERHWCIADIAADSLTIRILEVDDTPIVLPNIALPLTVSVEAASLQRLVVIQGDERIDLFDLEARASLRDTDLEVEKLSARHALGHVSLTGRVALHGDYPLKAEVEGEFALPEMPGTQRVNASVTGTVETLSVQASLQSPVARQGELGLSASLRTLAQPLEYAATLTWERLGWPLEGTPEVTLFDGEASISGTGSDYRMELETALDAPSLANASLSLAGRGNAQALQIEAVQIEHSIVDATAAGRFAWSPVTAASGQLELRRLDASPWIDILAAPVSGTAGFTVAPGQDAWVVQVEALQLDTRITELPLRVAGQLRADSAGRWETDKLVVASGENSIIAAGNGDLEPGTGNPRLTLDLAWDRLQWPPEQPALLATSDGRLRVTGQVQDYRITGGLKLRGADLPPADLTLSAKGNLERVEVTSLDAETLDGTVAALGQVMFGSPSTWSASAQFRQLDPAAGWPQLSGRLDGRIDAQGEFGDSSWSIDVPDLRVDGEFRDAAFALAAKAHADQSGYIRLDHLELSSGANTITAVGERREQWALQGTADLVDTETLVPGLSGTLNGQFTVTGEPQRPNIILDLSGRDLETGGARLRELQIDASLAEFGYAPSTLTVRGSGGQRGDITVDELGITLEGTRDRHVIRVAARGEPATFAAAARGRLDDSFAWHGEIDTAEVQALSQTWQLAAPVETAWRPADQTFRVPEHCWARDTATLCLTSPARLGTRGEAVVSLKGLRMETLQHLLPEATSLHGVVNADATASWQPQGAPQVRVEGTLRQGEIRHQAGPGEEPLHLAFDELRVRGELANRRLVADLGLQSGNLGRISAHLVIPVDEEANALSGRVNVDAFELVAVQPFFPQLTQIAGVVSAQGNLGGTLSRPDFTGSLHVAGFGLSTRDAPLVLQDGEIDVTIQGTRASFEGTAASGDGTLRMSGTASWREDPWAVELEMTGENLAVIQPPLLDARLSPDLRVRVNPGVVRVTGELAVPYARITVRDLPPDATRVSRDVVVVDAEVPAENDTWRIETRIRVTLGDDVRFNGLGLRAKLSGAVQVEQAAAGGVATTGEIRIDEGDYKAYAQDLEITEGRLLFVGPPERPDISLTAQRVVGEITAGIRVEGPIERPETTLFSTPPQTETDTLAYLVLGRPIENLGNTEDGQVLTQAALALGLSGGGRGLASRVADQFGIRDFEIEARSDSIAGPQVVLRGRLSPNLVVRYGVSVLTPVNTLTLQYELTERLYVEAAQGLENALDLFYSFDFQ